jgi:hypothetical protein
MSKPAPHLASNEPLVDDPAAAMARLRDATRKILAVPKSEIPIHVPKKRVKPAAKKPKGK